MSCEKANPKKSVCNPSVQGHSAVSHRRSVLPLVSGILSSPGRQLDAETRAFMESRLGHDFSEVRVHTDSMAAESASRLGARAFAAGRHVVFGAGEYSPETDRGKKLIAHELTHVIQQRTSVSPPVVQCQQKSETGPRAEFEAMLKEQAELRRFDFGVLVMKEAYKEAYLKHKAKVDDLLRQARESPFRLEYLAAIRTTLRTPDFAKNKQQEAFRQGNIKTFKEYSELAEVLLPSGGEEAAAKAVPLGKRVRLKGEGGKVFWVDRRDPRNLVVEAKVRLTGPEQHVRYVKNMEDLIEARCARPGYTVNLEFVEARAWDVFDVSLDLGEHPVSSRWSGIPERDVPQIIAHELHHLLGLPDRYDYLKLAPRGTLAREARLHWIGVQIQTDKERGGRVDPLVEKSLMGSGTRLHSADICAVVKLPVDQCVEARKGLD